MNNNLESVADKIKRYRKLKEMSQEQLSELSGINVSTIKKYECGLRNPKPDQLLKIATALGISINVFLSYEIKSVGDVLSTLIKLDEQTDMKISATKDENGIIDPNSITITFSNEQINSALAKYLQYKEQKEISDDNSNEGNYEVSYAYKMDELMIEIESYNNR